MLGACSGAAGVAGRLKLPDVAEVSTAPEPFLDRVVIAVCSSQ
jgi:hypothetical protein